MTQKVCYGMLIPVLVICMGLATTSVFGQNALTVDTSGALLVGFTPDTVSLRMDNPGDSVEGFVAAISYNTSELSVSDVSIAGTVTESTGAELVVAEIFEAQGGFTLGVVLDFNAPFGGQEIAAGSGQLIGVATVMADATNPGPGSIFSTLSFQDGVFNSPALDNILVINGASIGAVQGLTLNDGDVEIAETPPVTLSIEDTKVFSLDGPTAVRILMDNTSGPIQGFVLAIQHDDSIAILTDVNIDGTVTDSVGAEFVVADGDFNGGVAGGPGGTLGVVLDFDPPFDGQTIPVGADLHIANFEYACADPVVFFQGDPVPPSLSTPLTFVDGVLDSPALDNVVVISGLSINPILEGGTFTCNPVGPLTPEDSDFYCGVQDPATGAITDPEGIAGSTVQLCFFYTEGSDPQPNDGVPECVGDNIQAFQLAMNFDCNLNMVEDSFTTEGTILDAVGVEFVNVSIDNDPNDGDGCDMTIGILLDALPPFEGQEVPSTCDPLAIGCIDVQIKEGAPCGVCLPVEFRDGADGGENIPLNNVVVINNQSIQGFDLFDCNICVVPEAIFTRGDCNFDKKLDIADPQTTLSQQFQGFGVPCLDACDANDDGKINLADTVFLLNYLFDSGVAPPDPGPDPLFQGPDPTGDELDCEEGGVCP